MNQKAANLSVLRDHGICVPGGFVLDGTHYRDAVGPSLAEISSALPDHRRIREIFAALTIPERTLSRITEQIDLLGHPRLFAVRSSGAVVSHGRTIVEDSANVSLAGQFDSYLAVPESQVPAAVRLCWASLFNERSIASFDADQSYVERSSMSVVIQEMVPAAASAVMMTVDPLGDGSVGGIELALGPCEAIVSGIASPDEILFSRATGEIVHLDIGAKKLMVVYEMFEADHSTNGRLVAAPDAERLRLSVEAHVVVSLIYLAHRIEAIFGSPQDIEAVITHDNRIVITQARSITRLPPMRSSFQLLAA